MVDFLDFPDDENGVVLRRMYHNGDNLSIARNIDFTVVLPTEDDAEAFASHFRELQNKVTIENSGCVTELPWDVVVVKNMVPTHEAITAFEESLQDFAQRFGGRNDGWGCFNQKDS